MTLQIGQMLNNRYRIDRLLGQGGFGAVYLARDLNLDEAVAIKESLEDSPAVERQFRSEAKLLFKLRHANLPRVHDCFAIPGQGLYLCMDYVEGESLSDRLEGSGGPLPVSQVLAWIGQVCDALDYLHRQAPPVIHRDIKPANIIIAADGSPYLVDFGISKLFDPNRKTTVGARALTPGYSPPEQYGLAATDARSDIFALGSTLYHLLTGQAPPPAMDVTAGIARPPALPHVLNPNVPEHVSLAVMKAIQLNREERWQQAVDFKQALLAPAPPQVVQPVQPVRQSAPVEAGRTQVIAALHAPDLERTSPLSAPAHPKKRWMAGKKLRWSGLIVLALMVVCLLGVLSPDSPDGEQAGDTWVRPQDGMVMVYVPAGDFLMGSADSDGAANADEKPQHTVTLDDFWIDQSEVTNAMFRRFVTETAYSWGGSFTGEDNQPVVSVSWDDAVAYCAWVKGQLPTEAQWEKAARGTDGRRYPWGDQPASCATTIMDDGGVGCGKDAPWPVGSKPDGASPYGAQDMSGNVWEWVQDWYSETYYRHSPTTNPTGPEVGLYRVVRGGSWNNTAGRMHAAYRERDHPGVRFSNYGFRCAR